MSVNAQNTINQLSNDQLGKLLNNDLLNTFNKIENNESMGYSNFFLVNAGTIGRRTNAGVIGGVINLQSILGNLSYRQNKLVTVKLWYDITTKKYIFVYSYVDSQYTTKNPDLRNRIKEKIGEILTAQENNTFIARVPVVQTNFQDNNLDPEIVEINVGNDEFIDWLNKEINTQIEMDEIPNLPDLTDEEMEFFEFERVVGAGVGLEEDDGDIIIEHTIDIQRNLDNIVYVEDDIMIEQDTKEEPEGEQNLPNLIPITQEWDVYGNEDDIVMGDERDVFEVVEEVDDESLTICDEIIQTYNDGLTGVSDSIVESVWNGVANAIRGSRAAEVIGGSGGPMMIPIPKVGYVPIDPTARGNYINRGVSLGQQLRNYFGNNDPEDDGDEDSDEELGDDFEEEVDENIFDDIPEDYIDNDMFAEDFAAGALPATIIGTSGLGAYGTYNAGVYTYDKISEVGESISETYESIKETGQNVSDAISETYVSIKETGKSVSNTTKEAIKFTPFALLALGIFGSMYILRSNSIYVSGGELNIK